MSPAGGLEKFGKFEVVAKLGTGGMAEVFLCRLAGIGGFEKLVVVKRILPDRAEDPAFVRMFLDEARLTANLSHANIAHVYEIDQVGGVPYIAMEYVKGPTLLQLIRAARPAKRLHYGHMAKILAGVCAGLHHAHLANDPKGRPLRIIHRDVSPQNIIVSREGVPKLLDFGVAKANGRETNTETGLIKGKLRYMAPEIIAQGEIDQRADIFSAGVCLFEATTGKGLFGEAGESDVAVLKRIMEGRRETPTAVDPKFPPELEKIILWAIHADVKQRCPTARDLYDALEGFVAGGAYASTSRTLVDWMTEIVPHLMLEAAGPSRTLLGVSTGPLPGLGAPASSPVPAIGRRDTWSRGLQAEPASAPPSAMEAKTAVEKVPPALAVKTPPPPSAKTPAVPTVKAPEQVPSGAAVMTPSPPTAKVPPALAGKTVENFPPAAAVKTPPPPSEKAPQEAGEENPRITQPMDNRAEGAAPPTPGVDASPFDGTTRTTKPIGGSSRSPVPPTEVPVAPVARVEANPEPRKKREAAPASIPPPKPRVAPVARGPVVVVRDGSRPKAAATASAPGLNRVWIAAATGGAIALVIFIATMTMPPVVDPPAPVPAPAAPPPSLPPAKSPEVVSNEAVKLYLDEAEKLMRQRRLEPAAELLAKARAATCTDPLLNVRLANLSDQVETLTLVRKATRLLEADDRQEAMNAAKQALDRDPENGEALKLLATARMAQRAERERGPRRKEKAGTGFLTVTASRPGMVYLDDEPLGLSPVQGRAVEAGKHLIQVRAQGHTPTETEVTVVAGKPVIVDLHLVAEKQATNPSVKSVGESLPPAPSTEPRADARGK